MDSFEYAVSLSKYLSSRFHPELPHIGTVGTADPDFVEDVYTDEEEEAEEEVEDENKGIAPSMHPSQENSTFRFVPFSSSYRLKLREQKDNLLTKISFYLRINEGSWHDLQGDDNPGLQKDDPEINRDKEFFLTKDELSRSFRKFDLIIQSDLKTLKQDISLSVDGKKISDANEHIKTTENKIENGSEIQIELFDKSEPIIIRDNKNYFLNQQRYDVLFGKSIQIKDGIATVNVIITNRSPFTRTSDLPQIELKTEGKFETKEEAIARYKEETITKSDDTRELFSKWRPNLFKKKNAYWNARGSLYGHLLEFSVTEDGINSSNDPYEKESDVEQVINLVYDESLERNDDGKWKGSITYRNHIIFDEVIPPMALGGEIMEMADKVGMSKELSGILSKNNYKKLYKFQYDVVNAINSSLKRDKDSGVLLSSRTGGGKTEAFLFPILDYCLSNREVAGTKALIFYPTKALANDQMSRIVSLLYHVNNYLKSSGDSNKITVGIYHGDVPLSTRNREWQRYWNGIPLRCPACNKGYLTALEHTKAQCIDCKEELDFVVLFQEPNFGILPDIVVTNPDKLQWDMMERPDHHGIFGRKISCCENCFRGYAKLGKRKCDSCQATIFKIKEPLPPKFIVFDEVHQFKGTFGANTLYVLQRLKALFKKYTKANYDKDWTICSIGSSATISNALDFSQVFFGMGENDITIIPKDLDTQKTYYEDPEPYKSYKRTHLFVMPYRYRPGSTCAKAVGFLQARRVDGIKPEPFSEMNSETGEPLQMLGFVNSMQDLGLLINIADRERKYSTPVSVGGHSTDYDHEQRAGVERKFNQKELNVLFATPTLEVGVDFETVNTVLIYGFPFSFNDYIQRIGRGGRGENTLVVTICHNYKPIDHFFFVDAKKRLSMQHLSIEPIPITRDNPEIVKKHLVASTFDSISTLDDSTKIWEDVRVNLLEELETRGDQFYDTTKEFSPINIIGIPENEKEDYKDFLEGVIKHEIKRLRGFIQVVSPYEYLHTGPECPDKKFKLTNLRGTEDEVKVEMIWEVFEG